MTVRTRLIALLSAHPHGITDREIAARLPDFLDGTLRARRVELAAEGVLRPGEKQGRDTVWFVTGKVADPKTPHHGPSSLLRVRVRQLEDSLKLSLVRVHELKTRVRELEAQVVEKAATIREPGVGYPTHKLCSGCGKKKDRYEAFAPRFRNDPDKAHLRQSMCLECDGARTR